MARRACPRAARSVSKRRQLQCRASWARPPHTDGSEADNGLAPAQSVTRRVVLNMDHFCPWLNNCIGFYNHKAYLLSLFYSAVAHAAGLALLMPGRSALTIYVCTQTVGMIR